MPKHYQVLVVGGGLAGSIAAAIFANAGYEVGFVAPKSSFRDPRTTALMGASVDLLVDLGIWSQLEPDVAPLKTMRIVDGSKRLLRAPVVNFHAREIGLDQFGFNMPNTALLNALANKLAGSETIEHLDTMSSGLQGGKIELKDGQTISADLIIAADGRNSKLRSDLGIAVRSWSYPQHAVVLDFDHTRSHESVSTEFHTEDGPFTQVPLPGNRSSLVWVMAPEAVAGVTALDEASLSQAIEQKMQSMLGKVQVTSEARSFPLSGMSATEFGKSNVAIIGEVAHVIPPIGAQGLNLGVRDIQTLAEQVKHHGLGEKAVAAYDKQRRVDVTSRTAGVDLLNRSLLSSFLPVQILRAGGLAALGSITPLRNLAMREGTLPGTGFSSLMQDLREQIRR